MFCVQTGQVLLVLWSPISVVYTWAWRLLVARGLWPQQCSAANPASPSGLLGVWLHGRYQQPTTGRGATLVMCVTCCCCVSPVCNCVWVCQCLAPALRSDEPLQSCRSCFRDVGLWFGVQMSTFKGITPSLCICGVEALQVLHECKAADVLKWMTHPVTDQFTVPLNDQC